jgi:hypothetical protein
MHKIKEMLMKELYEDEEKAKKNPNGKVSPQELEKIHMLTDTIKNIGKIEMLDEGGYSEDGHYMGEGRIYGTSYTRGRRYAKRDSMGRYSGDDDMPYDGGSYARGGNMGNRGGYSRDGAKDHLIKKAEEMLEMAQDSEDKKAIRQFIARLENDD